MSAPGEQLAWAVGVNVAGFLRAGLGLGQAARLYVAALREAGVPVRTTSVDPRMPDVPGAQLKTVDFTDLSTDDELPFNLVCVNAPELPGFAADVGADFFEDRYTIGVWAWETDVIPPRWDPSFRLVDEIWVYSAYVAEILSHVSPVPVVRVPLPIVPPDPAGARVGFDLPDGFTFLFAFDFYSTLQRKNPLGLVEAFTRAFRPGEGPHLLLKSFNGDYKPERLARLQEAAGDRPDIHIVDRFITEQERAALMAACDCYVSLHRAEGFGLTLGEAMSLGKPVIATAYSSNLDFMTPANSYLVEHGMTLVGPEGENYPADGRWAEPDLDHAAALMREVWEDQDAAREKGTRAQREIAEDFSVAAVGALAQRRLRRIATTGKRTAGPAGGAAPVANGRAGSFLEAVEMKVTEDPRELVERIGGPKAVARRAALQAMRPYTHHQDGLNELVVAALRELRARLDDLELDTQSHIQLLTTRTTAISDALTEALSEAGLDPAGRRDLVRMLEGMRARPASTHPDLAFEDDHGRLVLGFTDAASAGDDGYRGFEDIFRAGEEELRAAQRQYVEHFADADWVLDLGCGRGEFLEALAESGIRGRGVDLDETMVARCQEKGLEVERMDAATALRGLDDGSLPAAFAAQVVEHLGHDELVETLGLLQDKLVPGGTVVLETVNPHSPAAMKAFWTDTTHHHPLFPEVLLALCRLAGFDSARVVFPETSGDFNHDVYESRDYAVVARTAQAPDGS